MGSSWQDRTVVKNYLDERRAAIPFGPEQVGVMLRLVRHFRPEPRRIFDLGCGDGFLARALLAEYPQTTAVLIDHSEPMLERARKAMEQYAGRSEIIQGDLCFPLKGFESRTPVDVVVSGFAIHHLPHVRKYSLYKEIFDLLTPGGLFVNIEHVASVSAQVEAIYDDAYVDHISARTGKERALVDAEYRGRPDRADNILESVEVQVNWLREIGYRHADCYFKWFELAVFGGLKGEGT